MTTEIEPWGRPAFKPTGRRASVMMVVFADDDVLADGFDLKLTGLAPAGVPLSDFHIRRHLQPESAEWIDGWRTAAVRAIAERDLGDLGRLDAATCCYSLTVDVDDPADLTHLQLAWAVAGALARQGGFAVLDVYAVNWLSGEAVAALAPDRPFDIQREVSLTAESSPTEGFGHPMHTRGMTKFGRPDLVAGVPADEIQATAQILNHLARILAEGRVLIPGQKWRIDGERTLRVELYTPGGSTPQVHLSNDGLLLTQV